MRIAFDLVSRTFFIVHFLSLYDLLTDPDTHDKIIFHLAARMTRVYSIYCRLYLTSSELTIASPSNVMKCSEGNHLCFRANGPSSQKARVRQSQTGESNLDFQEL